MNIKTKRISMTDGKMSEEKPVHINKGNKKAKKGVIEKDNFPIVGIGASAGGLGALKKFFAHLPPDSGLGFVLVQHLDPTHKSSMVELLRNYTSMEVVQVKDGMEVKANHVYVIPPNKDMGVLNGSLQLLTPAEPHGLRLPINFFLKSLAEDQKDNSVGIILSGFGADGSDGLKAIKSKEEWPLLRILKLLNPMVCP